MVQLLNGIGDYIDLRHALFQFQFHVNFRQMSLAQFKEYVLRNGHCSALVKVLRGDVYGTLAG